MDEVYCFLYVVAGVGYVFEVYDFEAGAVCYFVVDAYLVAVDEFDGDVSVGFCTDD